MGRAEAVFSCSRRQHAGGMGGRMDEVDGVDEVDEVSGLDEGDY